MEFAGFPKMARLSREVIITEKIDGTNAQVCIGEDGTIKAGSRTRWITPQADNFGFAAWVEKNADELRKLGPGRHFGEWWGMGIQRGYGMSERRFSLFNVSKFVAGTGEFPSCCLTVPVLYRGVFDTNSIELAVLGLQKNGSLVAPGFMNPEGVIIYHVAAGIGFKKTIDKDHEHKWQGGRSATVEA